MHWGCFVWTPTPPLAGRRTPRPGPVRVCVCSSVLAWSGGRASRVRCGAPHLFLWPLCLSALLGPLRAGVAPFFVLFLFFLCCFPRAPVVSCVLWFPAPGALGLGALFSFPPPPPACVVLPPPPFFFLPSFSAPVVSGFLWFPAPGALGLGAVCRLFCWPLASRLSVRSRLVCVFCPAIGCCPVVAAPPPSPFVSPCFCRRRSVPSFLFFFFFLFLPAPPLCPAFSGFRPRVPFALALCVVCSVGLLLLGSPCTLASFVSPARPLAAASWLPRPPPPSFCVSLFLSRPLGALFFFLPFPFCAPVVSGFLWFPAPGAAGLGAVCRLFYWSPASRLSVRSRLVCVSHLAVGCSLVVAAAPPPLCVSRFSSLPLGASFFFLLVVRPCCLWLSLVSGPGCPGPQRCVLFALLASRLSAPRALSPLLSFSPGRWLFYGGCCPAPPPPLVSRGFRRRRSVLCAVCCALLCVPGCGAAPRCGALCRPVLCCCVLCCFAALVVVPLLVVPRPVVLPVALGPCALRRCVLRCSLALCAPCCVCFVVACWCALLFAAVCCAVCVLGCCVVRSLSSPLCAVLCFAVLVRWRLVLWCVAVCCAVSFGVLWCSVGSGGPWLSAGGVFRCRCPCLAVWSASLRLVWFAVVSCLPVSCSVVLCCRVVLCCCALLSFCGVVGACLALLWPVVLCCVALLVVCAVFCLVVVSVCCGALSLPAGTHEKYCLLPCVTPRQSLSRWCT